MEVVRSLARVDHVERHPRELQQAEIDGVTIEAIEAGVVEWHDARTKAGNSPLSGFKDRVSGALKQLQKENPD